MTEILNKYIEIAASIYIYVLSAVMVVSFLVFAREPIIEQGEDKTLISSTGVQEWDNYDMTGRDILFMLINTDPMSPYPMAVRINDTPVIDISDEYVTKKLSKVGQIYVSSGEYKLSEMLDWKVTNKYYVYEGPDAPYIQYILEEVS